MRFPDSSGLLLSIVDGLVKNDEIMTESIDNYHYPFHDFIEKAKTTGTPEPDLMNYIQAPRLYIIAGHKDKLARIEQVWRTKVNQLFTQLVQNGPNRILKKIKDNLNQTDRYCLESMYWLYLSELLTNDSIFYPDLRKFSCNSDNLVVLAFYQTSSPEDYQVGIVDQILHFWLDRENPSLRGYQCLTRSFILRNMIGRKVLASFPDKFGNWGMLLEGGIFLPLAEDFESGLCKLNSSHIGQWTVGEIEELLLNPIYAFGYHFEYIDLVCEWFYVFLYALAITEDKELENVNIELLYQHFCEYLGEHICPYIQMETKIITINEFIDVLIITIQRIKEILKGAEETGVSKNILLMMRNRHAYLPEVLCFIARKSSLKLSKNLTPITLDYSYWGSALAQLEEITDSYEKGIKLEELATYFIRTIPGLIITEVRSKRGRAEVDIYCCNGSYDSLLWKLGALVLIECKNRKSKVDVSDIRNLIPTMEAKGITGALVFSKAGFSSVALDEIIHQLSGGKMILPIYLEELKEISEERKAYDLIRDKIEYYECRLYDSTEQLYF